MASRNMTALLALLAVAGWQNRDKLGELLSRATGQTNDPSAGATPGASPSAGGLGGLLGGLLGGGAGSQTVAGGLGDLLNSFTGSGQEHVAKSWVETGPNNKIEEPQLEEALGSDTIDQLAEKTGLSREELLARLKSVLPIAVDKLTPQGRLPTEAKASRWQV